MNEEFRVKFWGVRGGIPVSGPQFTRYGGNTSCVEISHKGRHLLFDAGSGLREAAREYKEHSVQNLDLFFTHTHYDHIIGLPFFKPIYNPSIHLTLWSGHLPDTSTHTLIEQFMRPPWFPVKADICRASIAFKDFRAGDVIDLGDGIVLRTAALNHPGGCVGYRVEWDGRVVSLIYDTEHVEGELDQSALFLMQNADLAIYDATYTAAEMKIKKGFGHSTWQEGVKLSREAKTKQLALFHHSADREDDALDNIRSEASAAFPAALVAADGMTITL